MKHLGLAIGLVILFFLTACNNGAGSVNLEPVASVSTEGLSADFFNHPYFPHPENWREPTSHGLRVISRANTINDCAVCHDKNSTNLGSSGGTGNAPAGCKSCHSVFPHDTNWGQGESHGQYVLNNGTGDCTGQCHGAGFDGGLSGVSCNRCHNVYPHVAGWQNKNKHGSAVLTLGQENCQSCHGEDLNGGTSKISCYSCHSDYPHASDWQTKAGHGQAVLVNGQDSCQGCHGEDLSGGDTGVSCMSCHATYPHDITWNQAAKHGITAKGSGKNLCKGCHGEDLLGGNTGVSCYSCHAVYPHANNWDERASHGQYVVEQGDAECTGSCHGEDLSGGLSGISCLTGCHSAAYPHPNTWNNQAYRGTDDFHGQVAQGSGKTQCMTCHGNDFEGGTSGVSCFSCHENYPHLETNWLAEGPDNLHAATFIGLAQNNNTEKCTVCHGENYDREVGGIKCIHCHTSGITHMAGWSGGAGHGTFFSSQFTADDPDQYCQDCHGAPVKFTDTTSLSSASVCNNCHNITSRTTLQTQENLTATASSCYSCHWSYPHIGYEVQDAAGNTVIDAAWGPTVGDLSGSENGFYFGHVFYQLRNPGFTDTEGNLLGSLSPFVANGHESDIIANTCAGGTAGSCHDNGNRSTSNALANTVLCSSTCHQN